MPIVRPREVSTQVATPPIFVPPIPIIPMVTTMPPIQPVVIDNDVLEQLNESLTILSIHLAQGVGPTGTISRPPPKRLVWP